MLAMERWTGPLLALERKSRYVVQGEWRYERSDVNSTIRSAAIHLVEGKLRSSLALERTSRHKANGRTGIGPVIR